MNHDIHTTINIIRPETAPLDDEWSFATLENILATEPARRPEQRLGRRGRIVVAGVVGIGLLGSGAAAANLASNDFTSAFSGWGVLNPQSEPNAQAVDPATARRVATTDGPGSTAFSLVAAPGRGDYTCVAALFESPTSIASPLPVDFVDANGSLCAPTPPADAAFADMEAGDTQRLPKALGEDAVTIVSVYAGPAVRAVISTEGEQREMVRYEGRFYGWYTGDGGVTNAILTGYRADGSEVDNSSTK